MNKTVWLALALAALVLAGCGGSPAPMAEATATPNPGEIALQMMQQQMAAEATSQAVALQLEATRQVFAATATEAQRAAYGAATEQARADAIATEQRQRADAQATQARLDLDAATQQARRDGLATQSALSTATFVAWTLTAIPPHATMTQVALEQDIDMRQHEVELSDLRLKQQADTNVIQWALPAVLIAALVVGFIVQQWNHGQVREVRDENGEIAAIIYKNRRAVRPDLFASPVLELEGVSMPALAAPQEQSEIVKRAQAIKALSVMPDMPPTSAATFAPLFSEGRKDAFDIIEGEAAPTGLIDGEALKALDKDWKEAEGE